MAGRELSGGAITATRALGQHQIELEAHDQPDAGNIKLPPKHILPTILTNFTTTLLLYTLPNTPKDMTKHTYYIAIPSLLILVAAVATFSWKSSQSVPKSEIMTAPKVTVIRGVAEPNEEGQILITTRFVEVEQ